MPSGIGNKNLQQLRLTRKKLAKKRKLAQKNSQSDGHAQPEAPLSESQLRRVDMEVDDSDCDHPTGASGNEDSGSDSGGDSDSEVEMTDAEDLEYGTKDFTAHVYKGHR